MSPDGTYRVFVAGLPGELRALAVSLPHRLGLTHHADGEWSDFAQLEPNRDLPRFIADDVVISRERLDQFSAAHHLAGIFGIVADRLADGQAAREPAIASIRGRLLRGWEAALSGALEDPAAARRMIAEALFAWRRGVLLERRAFARRRFADGEYPLIVSLKLRWISTTAQALLPPERAVLLRRSYDYFLFGLQCRDDAFDSDEDEQLRGLNVAAALGVPVGALVRAAPRLIRSAARLAEQGGFQRLAEWMSRFSREIDGRLPGGLPAQDDLWGVIVAHDMDFIVA